MCLRHPLIRPRTLGPEEEAAVEVVRAVRKDPRARFSVGEAWSRWFSVPMERSFRTATLTWAETFAPYIEES